MPDVNAPAELDVTPKSVADTKATATPHRVVIIGGGAAGLELVTRLGDTMGKQQLADITLIERERAHLWKPLLHAVAAGSLDPDQNKFDYLAQAHWHHFRYRLGEMVGLDRATKQVHLAANRDEDGREITPIQSVSYDTLVIAVGSVGDDFGTPGVKEYAVSLDTTEEALRFNRRLENAFISADAHGGTARPGQLHVAIIGAGATGSELSALLVQSVREIVAYGIDGVDPQRDVRIILIEGANRILPTLSERISEATLKQLSALGVEIHTGARVSEVTGEGVRLANGEFLPASLVVWSAGIKAPAFLRDLDGLETNRHNQLVVTETLQTTRDPNIFAIGDCGACPWQSHTTPVPARAQAAHQEASHLSRQIGHRIGGKPLQPYAYRDFGSLISLGEYRTVGNIMGLPVARNFFVDGYFARLMYRSLYLMHEIALCGWRKTLLETLARRLSQPSRPPVKLH